MEILFVLMLGLLLLGPKRLHTMLAHVARAKAELENATRGLKSQLAAELDADPRAGKTDCSLASVEDGELSPTPNRHRLSRTCRRPDPEIPHRFA
jgi:Sec-independent protein translocase protein TatA